MPRTGNYTIPGVTPGVYRLLAFLDARGDGILSTGEPHVSLETAPVIAVGTSNVTDQNVVLPRGRVSAHDTTHTMATSRALAFSVQPNRDMPVRVTICSGPNITLPYDLGVDEIEETRFIGYVPLPLSQSVLIGDAYQFVAEYADGSTEPLSVHVTNVIIQLATAVAPKGEISEGRPEFSWTLSADLRPNSVQSVQVFGAASRIWEYENLASTVRSVEYDADGRAQLEVLEPGQSYDWQIRIRDSHGNTSSANNVSFSISDP